MAHCRSIVALGMLAMWLTVPALACLPTPQMTDAEMACCKKMAGDCEMGTAQHPCCKTTTRDNAPYLSNSHSAISAPTQATTAVLPVIEIIGLPDASSQFVTPSDAHAPPESPPALTSILRV
jgi:hypothetical protein